MTDRPDPTTAAEAAERIAETAIRQGAEAVVLGNEVTMRWNDGPWVRFTVTIQ